MKHFLLTTIWLISWLFRLTALGQTIQNPGFEMGQQTESSLPVGWAIQKRGVGLVTNLDSSSGVQITLDKSIAKSGNYSLRISRSTSASMLYRGFAQACTLQVTQPTKLRFSASVKVTNSTPVMLWCEVWNQKKIIGSTNTLQQGSQPCTSGDWCNLNLTVLVTPDVHRLIIGGTSIREGSAWFDDFQLETIPIAKAEPSATVKAYLNEATAIIEKHALVRDSIPWALTKANLLAFAGGMQTQDEVHPLVSYLIGTLRNYGDNHSFFQSPSAAKSYTAPPSAQPAAEPKAQAKFLGEGIGYISVPQFGSVNETRVVAFATDIQQQIRQIDQIHSVGGWIVDLRENGGGNMWPMLAGLGPLVGEGRLGYFISNEGETPWFYQKGAAYPTKPAYGASVKLPYRLRNENSRVAVLIGPQTASSGEMTAIAFIGRPNTRLFGLPSGGFTTANASYPLPDGAQIYLASSVTADRTHKQYPQRLVPDEEIKVVATEANDPILQAAKVWLLAK